MSAHLDLGAGLRLPLSAVTQTFGILGKRGVGKTHMAVVLAEELLEQRLQVVVIDPVGVWWGLRSSADGKKAGHGILILGGEHGDLPLEASAGRLIADFVIGKTASVVLDLGEFSKADQSRFVTDFLERLYHKNRTPLQLIIDEADAFAPQRIHRGAERCFGAVDTVVRRGRARGLGVTLVTQRSAAINKDVLTQTEVLVAFRTIAPQDRAAIEAWIEVHADDEGTTKKVLASLHELEVGEAWVWSPAWLKLLQRVRIRRRQTFDSSATPEVGKRARAPGAVAKVDVDALRGELAQLVSKAEQEDPRRLQKRIGELQRQLTAKPAAAPAKVERVEIPTLSSADRRTLEAVLTGIRRAETAVEKWAADLGAAGDRLNGLLRPEAGTAAPAGTPRPAAAIPSPSGRPASRPPASAGHANGHDRLPVGERAVLTAVAQHTDGVTREQLTQLTGYKRSTRDAYVHRLGGRGLLELQGSVIAVTEAGLVALGDFEPLPTGDALRDYWLGRLPEGERKVLSVLADAYPHHVNRENVTSATGYARSTRDAYLSRLTARRLVQSVSGGVRAAEVLFG